MMRSRDRERGEEIGGEISKSTSLYINDDEENVNERESASARVEKRNALERERERKERTIGVATFAILFIISSRFLLFLFVFCDVFSR
jgi:hypothetical protein